jgi:8-oxo-dGTP diphosphatase
MKMSLKVVCGILIWNDKVLIGKRKLTNEHQPGKWEFPGGKMEEGETFDETIIREFKEELDIDISVFHELRTLNDENIEFTPMIVKLKGGKAKLLEHEEIKFVDKKEFFKMDLTKLSKQAGRIFFDSYFIFLRKGE